MVEMLLFFNVETSTFSVTQMWPYWVLTLYLSSMSESLPEKLNFKPETLPPKRTRLICEASYTYFQREYDNSWERERESCLKYYELVEYEKQEIATSLYANFMSIIT